jgi:hypothetical protein
LIKIKLRKSDIIGETSHMKSAGAASLPRETFPTRTFLVFLNQDNATARVCPWSDSFYVLVIILGSSVDTSAIPQPVHKIRQEEKKMK